ncbi:MAG: lipid A-modifier LpxR family protein [Pseudomonadota bacterium]
MVAIAFGLMAIASGAAVGEVASDSKISNPALAMATRVERDNLASGPVTQRGQSFLSGLSIEVLDAAPRDAVGFSPETSLGEGYTPGVEVQLSAATPFNLDVGVARRQVSGQNSSQYSEGGGTEVRLGQNLSRLAPEFKNPDAGKTAWYMFAATDGRALTWTPSADLSDPNRNLRIQDRAEIGEGQLGVTMQRKGMQASLALVQRTVKTRIGPFKQSKDESFAGLTLTWKR